MKVRPSVNVFGENEVEVLAEPGDTLEMILGPVEACIDLNVIWGVDLANATPELRDQVTEWVKATFAIEGEAQNIGRTEDGLAIDVWEVER